MPHIGALTTWLGTCGFDGSQQVVVYDDSYGAMATRLWWLLKCLGHDAVALLDGGWQAWSEQGLAVDAGLPQHKPANYTADFNPQCVVTTDQVVLNLTSPQWTLIDVRTAERYRGEQEPIDPIAGHIPGAVNLPLAENLDGSIAGSLCAAATSAGAGTNRVHVWLRGDRLPFINGPGAGWIPHAPGICRILERVDT